MTVFAYPLAYPTTKGVSRANVRQRSVVGQTRSPFTGEQQVQQHQGQWFEMTVVHPPMVRADAEDFLAFYGKLNGIEGTFLFGVPNATITRGTAEGTPGTPLVNGASQLGNDLIFDGGPASATGYLLPGDYIQINTAGTSRYHKILLQVDTDVGGAATMTIWPSLRESPVNNATLAVSAAKGVFQLSGESAVSYEITTAGHYIFTVEMMERI